MRRVLTYLAQTVGVLGILASVPLYFFAKFFGSVEGQKPASYSSWETIWQVGSYFLFFIILIVTGWYFRKGSKNA